MIAAYDMNHDCKKQARGAVRVPSVLELSVFTLPKRHRDRPEHPV
jgi:hypothetical protein